MKVQATELPLMKNQKRKRTPKKIAPLIAIAFLLTIIPIYYPSILFPHKKTSEYSSSSSYNTIEDSITPSVQKDNKPYYEEKSSSHGDDQEYSLAPKTTQEKDERTIDPIKLDDEKIREKDGENQRLVSPSQRGAVALGVERSQKGRKKSPRPHRQDLITRNERRRQPSHRDAELVGSRRQEGDEKCDIFSGEWVENPEGPYYTNKSCWAIQEHQNCIKYGRPDTGFLKWRWKPDGCELPVFDPYQFLEIVRGKSLAFVGDSVARNHMQSLLCLLSRVVYPLDVSNTSDENFKRWEYKSYNFNISIFWAPYLVRTQQTDPNDVTRPFNLYLDEFNEDWTTKIEEFDYVIISAGHWFNRPTMSYIKRRLIGCLYCHQNNITDLTSYFIYRRAFRTAFRAINSMKKFKGITYLRTFAPSHFENGPWNKGGDCSRIRPFKRNETVLDDYNLEFYKIQLQEIRIAERIGRRKGLKFRLLDTTEAMLLRPDGHPNKYGHWPHEKKNLPNDCVHWCLPGPIDAWNDFLLEMMKRDRVG